MAHHRPTSSKSNKMNQKSNVIIINGKQYDARTGKPVQNKAVNTSAGSIDGIAKKTSTANRNPGYHSKVVHGSHTKSKTLRRNAVKKPALSHTTTSHTHHSTTKPKTHITGYDPHREQRAKATEKSQHISKFQQYSTPPAIHKKTAHIPVAANPTVHTSHQDPKTVNHYEDHDDISAISRALEQANSHNQPPVHNKTSSSGKLASLLKISPKVANIGMSSFAVMLLAGFFVFQNMPTLAMRVAMSRSGVEATVPSYSPSGFSMSGPIHYSPGSITLQYAANTDKERSYSVTQESSNWNSETLRENFVAINRRPYQTYQGKGKTIYVYDTSSATWVDSGVWYKIEGNSSLNSDQLLKLANSL